MAYHRPFSVRMSTLAVTLGLFYVLSLSVHSVSGENSTTDSTTQTSTVTIPPTTAEKPYNETCSSGDKCIANLTCVNFKCGCNDTEYYNTSQPAKGCQPKKPYNETCSSGDKCIGNLTCVNFKCGCNDTEYYNTNQPEKLCQPKKQYNDICSSPGDKCIADLTCVNGKCGCTDTEYYNPSDPANLCQPKLDYTDLCDLLTQTSTTNECKGDNTACTFYNPPSPTKRCLCAADYYRSDSQTCVHQNNLKVNLNVDGQIRGAKYIAFSWTDGSNRGNINYTISWNGGTFSANKNGINVTGLTPGTQNNFSMISTLPADSYYPIITVESKYTLWTYPAKPGAVMSVTLISSSPYKYNISFGRSEGAVFHYKIDVAGDASISNTSTSESVILALTPGKNYSYTLYSVSGKLEESEPMRGSFLTPAAASGPVQNLKTDVILDLKANIKWQKPSNENGKITGYLVQVKQAGEACLYNIKLPCNGCLPPFDVNDTSCQRTEIANSTFDSAGYYHLELPNLKPYHDYTVQVMAVNEKGLGEPQSTTFRTEIGVANSISDLSLTSTREDSNSRVSLNISWTSGEFTGPTTYYILVEKETGLNSNKYSSDKLYLVTGYTTTSFILGDVLAFWNYAVSVMAGTDKGNSSSTSKQIQTAANKPGAVEKLNVSQDAVIASNLIATFSCPEERERNGTITGFEIRQSLLTSDNKTVKVDNYTVSATTSCNNMISFTGMKVTAEQNYKFAVKAVNNLYEGDFGESFFLHISPRIPRLEETFKEIGVQHLVKKSTTNALEETRITVDVCAKCLTDDRQGKVTKVGLIICVKGQECETGNKGRKKRSTNPGTDYSSFPTWSKAKVNDFKESYRTTPDDWIQTLKYGDTWESFIIGQNTTCGSQPATIYCNGPLPAGKEFRITTIVCTSAGCDSYQEDEVFVVKVPTDDNTGPIVGGVLGGLAFIAIICVIIFLIWRSRRHIPKTSPSNSFKNSVDKGKEIKPKRPVKIRSFNDHVTRFHKDSNLLFQDEFESIQTLSKAFVVSSEQGKQEQNKGKSRYADIPLSKPLTVSCEQAKLEQNRGKNRYVDIIPYDHSRVKLDILPDDDDETKDFINANYIPGYNSVREYIATQGPMYSTIPDFWRMAWEQKCKVIVMLSDLMEQGKRKVDLYWPENLNEPINYEHVVVEMTNFSQLNEYIIRNFKITKGDEVRKMTHFFVPGWSDFSADVGLDFVLGFVKLIRQEATPANPGPIIVHCSAGVGRTGTLIALDYFTQFVEKHSLDDEIDIFDFVMQMRRNRCRMVQVESQYIFIYDAINKVIQQKLEAEKKRLYENSSSNGVYANMGVQEENIYQNAGVKDKYVYSNEAFESDYSNIGNSKKSEKPTTEL